MHENFHIHKDNHNEQYFYEKFKFVSKMTLVLDDK